MRFGNSEVPTFPGAAGSKPAVVERFSLYDSLGNEVAFFNKAVDGSMSFEVDGVVFVKEDSPSITLAASSIVLSNLPEADPEVEGALWNDAGAVKVSAGEA